MMKDSKLNPVDRVLMAERARLGINCSRHLEQVQAAKSELSEVLSEVQSDGIRDEQFDRLNGVVDRLDKVVDALETNIRSIYAEMATVVHLARGDMPLPEMSTGNEAGQPSAEVDKKVEGESKKK